MTKIGSFTIGLGIISSLGIVWFFVSSQKPTAQPMAHKTETTCPETTTLITPVDTSLVTSMLWPGQSRGDDFKAHGGFRFDTSQPDDINVKAPLDARLTDASRYLSSGDEQYLLFFSTPCNLQFRFDHIRTLSPKLTKALASLPLAKPNDSRTTQITDIIEVAAGENIASSVGIATNMNVFVDFGLYSDRPDSNTGLCFFDYLSPSDSSYLRNLPTGKEGKVSVYCQ